MRSDKNENNRGEATQETTHTGTLIIIGGHEDKEREKRILCEVARRIEQGRETRGGVGKLIIATVASHEPEGYFQGYQDAFAEIGLRDLEELDISRRIEATDDDKLRLLDDAVGVFFSGGDQLKITSQLGGTATLQRIREIYENGGVIAGTSAGASVLCETMLVKGTGRESYRIGDLRMAPGLGLIQDVIVDQHFAERGRMGRLLGAVAHNPQLLGIGIDEDTAIVVEGNTFSVLGSGAVYVVDASGVTHSNLTDKGEKTLSLYDVRLHVLSEGDEFNVETRRPAEISQERAVEAEAKSLQACSS